MSIFTPIINLMNVNRGRAIGLLLLFVMSVTQVGISQTTFTQSNLDLGSGSVELSTYLQFGPDGRLYVAELYGLIKAYTVTKDGPNAYRVTNEEIITGVYTIPNHDDDGSFNSKDERELTAIVVGGTASNPVIYASSSDPWSGGPGGDVNKDTNSGVITRLTWTGSSWSTMDLVRGLPASEENHASHGLELATINGTNYLILCQGGNTNAGSPSQNFAWTTEYALSAAILAINLDVLDGMSTKNDGRPYKYDLPTVDDPTRDNANGIIDPNQAGYNGIDVGDPWGGNDGLNQAKLVPGGPVQIFSPGYRNTYDMVITESGALYATDNGANAGWGGFPENEGLGGNATNNYRVGEPGSSSPDNGEGPITNEDHLSIITTNINSYTFGSFYGGHPNPIRSNPSGAGLFTKGPHSSDPGDSNGNSYTDDWFRNTILDVNDPNFETRSLPVDWPPVPVSAANPVEGDYRLTGAANPDGPSDAVVTTLLNNSNGIDEYTASGDMKGSLIIGRSNGSLHRIFVDGSGNLISKEAGWVTGLGSDANALGITCNGDNDPFPGTIWVGTFNDKIVVLEPNTEVVECILPGESGYDAQGDNDNDGYTNEDEDLNGTDLCAANSKPEDFDDDKVSDLLDLDDDNDGINDEVDPFQLGVPFNIPVTNELFNNQSLLKGYKGLGLTGLMNNGDANPNYLNWLDDPDASNTDSDDILGGAIGAVTIYQTSGDATTNNQEKAFQYGVNVNSNSGKIIVSSRMLVPFQNFAADESQGIYIGTGFQDNYVKLILTAGGLEVRGENNDVALTGLPSAAIGIPSANLDLLFKVDPAAGTAQAAYSTDGGTTITDIGSPFALTGALLTALQDSNTPMAVGIIGTSGANPEYAASWDFLNVATEDDVAEGAVVFRVNAGGETIPAIDGGLDWVSDIDATLPANGFTVNAENNTAFGPPSSWAPGTDGDIQSATPFDLFQWERWDVDDPEPEINMTYTFNVGDAGDYTVRLFFRDTYSGTSQPGQRVFSVNINGVSYPALTDIDISANPGPDLAAVIEVDVTIATTQLEVEFIRDIQSAFVSGLEIVKGGDTGVPIVAQSVPNQTNEEGDNANITVVASGGDSDLTFSATGLPAGVSIDPTNGLIGGTIDPGTANGSPYNVIVTVDDNDEFNSDAKVVSFIWTITTNGGIPDSWTNITNTSEHIPRHENSMVQAGDKFYIFGGRESPNVVEAYDYNTNTWSTVSNGPEQFNHFQATTYEGLIWVIGAFEDNVYPVETPEEFIWIFDPASNEWIQGPSIPVARRRGSAGLVVYNNKFYVAGGNTIGHDGGYVPWLDEYDPVTNTWTALTDAPNARDHFHATVVDGKLYMTGGRLSGGDGGTFEPRIEEVDVYDFGTETWTTLPAASNLPTPRGGTTTVNFKGEVVVIGGEGDGQAFDNAEALDPSSGTWRSLAAMNNARHGTQAIVSGDGIHISSGSPNQGGGSQNNMEVYGIDNPTGTALVASSLSAPATATIDAAATEIITISNTTGNTGIFITNLSLGGDNAADFAITGGNPGPFLLAEGASHQISVINNGSTNSNTALLTVSYGEASTATVAINVGNNTAPVAAFTATPTSGEAPLAVAFDASTSSDPDQGDVLTYSWDFGDGASGTGVTANHSYTSDGQYTATLTVSDGTLTGTATEVITVGSVGPGQSVYRVNAGGETLAAIDGGTDWISDIDATLVANGFEVTGATSTAFGPPPGWDPAVDAGVQGSTPFDLFQWERWDQDDPEPEVNMTYNFNMASAGTYTVRLYFRDTYSGTAQPGQRVFSVTLNDVAIPALTDIDLAANPGPNLATMIEVETTISGNNLAIAFLRNQQSPMVSGIEILQEGGGEIPIVVQAIDNQTSQEGAVISLGVQASGGDGALNYEATGLPPGLGIDPVTGLISGTIEAGAITNSPYAVQITVDDADAGTADAQVISFDWVITTENTNTAPVASFIATPTAGDAPLLVSFDASASSDVDVDDVLTYSWDFGDGNNGTGLTTSHTYLAAGVYTATLTVSDGEASSTATAIITVTTPNTAPVAFFIATPTSGNAPLLVSFDASASSDVDVDDVLTYSWDFGDGDSGTGVTTSHTYLTVGVYTATLTVSDGELTNTTTVEITVTGANQPPVAAFVTNTISGLAPLVVNFDAAISSDPDDDPLTYSWDFGDGNLGTGVSITHTYVTPGFYTATLTVSDGQASSETSIGIRVDDPNSAPLLAFSANPTTGTGPLFVNFDASGTVDPENDPMTFNWDFGDGSSSTDAITSHTFQNEGVYTVTLTVSDGALSSQGTVNIVVEATGCEEVVVNSNDFESGWGIWNDGGSDARRSLTDAEFANSGNYCVRIRDNSSTSFITSDVLDLSSFDEVNIDLNFLPVSMDNASEDFWLQISTDGGSSWDIVRDWDAGIDFNNNERVFETVQIAGPFSADTKFRFRVDASGNSDWIYLDDVVIRGCSTNGAQNQAPTALFLASTLIGPAPLAVDFDASLSSDPDGDPLTYTWDFGDGSTATGVSPSHVFQSTGTYTVKLTVSDGQASTESIVTIFAGIGNEAPIAVFDATPTTGDAPLLVSFDASGSSDPDDDPLTYSWAFGDGTTGVGVSPTHTYVNGGVYTATLTVSDGQASTTATKTITVIAPNVGPTASFTATPTSGDAALLVNFNASGSSDPENDPLTYSWTFGDGGTGTGVSPSHTYVTAGVYTATLTVSDGEFSDQATQVITVNVPNLSPTASFTATPTSGDVALLVSFDASGSSDPENDPLTYNWAFGDGGTGTGVSPTHTYTTGGIFTVTLTVSDGQSVDQATTTITVISPNQGPTALFLASVTSGPAPLNVSFDGGLSSDPENDPLTYSWTFGDGGTATGVTPSYQYNTPGVYTVTLTVSDGALSDQSTTTITVTAPNQAPTASFTATPTSGDAALFVSFDATGSSDPENDPLTYSWNFGDGSSGTGITTTHTYLAGGEFTVTLTVNDGAAIGTATTTITVQADGCSTAVVNAEDFEDGWGIWNDGGADSRRNAYDADYANSGIYTIRLRDNSSSSHMTTDALDLSTYEELTVDFTYITVSMDNVTEDFMLLISTDGGSSFTELESWRRGLEFDNNERKFEQVIIPGPFSDNTVFRFLCDASNNSDWVYIDDVVITGCTTGTTSGRVASNTSGFNANVAATAQQIQKEELGQVEVNEDLSKVVIFPNPTRNALNIRNLPVDASLQLFDLNGKLLINTKYTETLDLTNYSNGIYILSVKTETAVRRIKVIKD